MFSHLKKGDSFPGTRFSCCNHKFIGLFLVKSSLDESHPVSGHIWSAEAGSRLLPTALGGDGLLVFLPVISLPADLARPTDLVAAALCQSQLQPVSNI